jgi:hypothetical protein
VRQRAATLPLRSARAGNSDAPFALDPARQRRSVSMGVGSENMHPARIMYIERKDDGLTGPARIGRVSFSKSGKTLYYRGQTFSSCGGAGFKCNFFDADTEIGYWISGCKRNGRDRLYPGIVEIDEDVREEYWVQIRRLPECKERKAIRCPGKYGGKNAWKV